MSRKTTVIKVPSAEELERAAQAALPIDETEGAHAVSDAQFAPKVEPVSVVTIPDCPARFYRSDRRGNVRLDGDMIAVFAGQVVKWTDREVAQAMAQGLALHPVVDPEDPREQAAKALADAAECVAKATGREVRSWASMGEVERDAFRGKVI
jgi:hypothetical protein